MTTRNCCICMDDKPHENDSFSCGTCESGFICGECYLDYLDDDSVYKYECPCCRTVNWKMCYDIALEEGFSDLFYNPQYANPAQRVYIKNRILIPKN